MHGMTVTLFCLKYSVVTLAMLEVCYVVIVSRRKLSYARKLLSVEL